ncbi:cardiolipin synthase [Roseimicrobium gellanilyticum]|uniref:Cardiolipin synthase n=1 Tax=Roseimicrobium gellanilyticum TaxID=748857 RepID=A0A366H1Q4_9BACT|nr:phospholipase D-like domain-containing protein [Roseimicrobium gellanilyticum]RBP35698.1 cardiolipin synthase [Roseimicrobium gellanilyticum]
MSATKTPPRKRTKTATKSPSSPKFARPGEGRWSTIRWGKLSIRGWVELLLVFIAAICLYAILFVRRQHIEYRPAHTFSVQDPAFFSSAHAATNPVPIEGNRITLLHNGNGIFPVMLEAIRGAKKTVNFEAFLFHSGEIGNQFIEALVDRAKHGVEVRVLLDGIGSGTDLKNSDVQRLTDGGCKFAYYHPTRALRVDRLNRRTHRRVLVVDGKVAFTGGAGFADEWRGDGAKPENWREVHAKLEGPMVAQLQSAFQQHWLSETGEMLSGAGHFPLLEKAGDLKTQVTTSDEFTVAALPLIQAVAIAAAEKTIYITNPYCTPTDEQVHLLGEAVKRGVDVKMILPGKHNDQPATKAAGRGSYGKLLEAGVKIYEFKPTMIHSKTMVVDGMFAMFGTSNLDARSSLINEEIDVSVYDASFGTEMDRVFREDLKNCQEYKLEDFKKRSLKERVTEWLVYPFHSQL